MALEDNLNRWTREINAVLAENVDVQDEQWFKTLHTALILITRTLNHLEAENEKTKR